MYDEYKTHLFEGSAKGKGFDLCCGLLSPINCYVLSPIQTGEVELAERR